MRPIKVPVVVAALVLPLGCGGPEPATVEATPLPPAVVLHQTNWQPGCYTDIDSALAGATGQAFDMVWQRLAMIDMQHSFDLQYAMLVSRPVLDDPTALTWRVEGERSLIEGYSVVRGEAFGVLSFGVTMTMIDPPDQQRYLAAEIRYSPPETTYVLNDVLLTYHDHYARMDDHFRGCDPGSGVSFAVAPWVADGAVVDSALLCWRDPAVADPPLQRTTLECQRAVSSVLGGQLYGELRELPTYFLY